MDKGPLRDVYGNIITLTYKEAVEFGHQCEWDFLDNRKMIPLDMNYTGWIEFGVSHVKSAHSTTKIGAVLKCMKVNQLSYLLLCYWQLNTIIDIWWKIIGWIDGLTEGLIEGQTDRRMDKQTNEQTDRLKNSPSLHWCMPKHRHTWNKLLHLLNGLSYKTTDENSIKSKACIKPVYSTGLLKNGPLRQLKYLWA